MRLLVALFAILSALPAAAQESPESVYAKFHAAAVAQKLDEMLRYAPAARRAEIAALPAAQKEGSIQMLSRLLPGSFVIEGTTPGAGTSDRLTLHATGVGKTLLGGRPETQYGTIAMLREGGEWKVDSTNWSNSPPAVAPAVRAAGPSPVPQRMAVKAEPAPAPAPKAVSQAPTMKPGIAKPKPAPVVKRSGPCVYKPVMTDEDINNCR